jgi:hypothetical protein
MVYEGIETETIVRKPGAPEAADEDASPLGPRRSPDLIFDKPEGGSA